MPSRADSQVSHAKPAKKRAPKHGKQVFGKKAVPLHIGNLLSEDIKAAPIDPPKPVFSNLAAAKSDVGLDIGGDLPWPVPKSPMVLPGNREIGFHVGVNYRLGNQWDLTGLAGAGTTGIMETDPLKPNVEQIGIQARYRF